MKVLLAPDSFKGSMSALRFCEVAEEAIAKNLPDVTVLSLPMSDGGEGLVDALVHNTAGRKVWMEALDPLGRPIQAVFGILGDQKTAVVELAAASGLPLLTVEERDPRIASTFGTGQLLLEAIRRGCREIVLGIGGSATNDGGAGALEALGFRFLDAAGNELPRGGAELVDLAKIDTSEVSEDVRACRFRLACDVDNPLTGPSGASATYGPQKGASIEVVQELDRCLARFAEIASARFEVEGLEALPGGGAAGGTSAGFAALLGAELRPGFEMVAEQLGLAEILDREVPDLVITGEGRIDDQTAQGKLPAGVAGLAFERGIPCIALAGAVDCSASALKAMHLDAAFSIVTGPMSANDSMKRGEELLARAICRIVGFARRLRK